MLGITDSEALCLHMPADDFWEPPIGGSSKNKNQWCQEVRKDPVN